MEFLEEICLNAWHPTCEGFVGLIDLEENWHSFGVLVLVRVVLQGEAPVGFLDILLCGAALDLNHRLHLIRMP